METVAKLVSQSHTGAEYISIYTSYSQGSLIMVIKSKGLTTHYIVHTLNVDVKFLDGALIAHMPVTAYWCCMMIYL